MTIDTLTEETMTNVRNFFNNSTKHRPNEETYEALTDIAETMEAMANGTAEPKIYLSSLDPGTGKTTVITQFIKCLSGRSKTNPALNEIGVIICLSRLEEIRKMVAEMGLDNSEFACLTADSEVNGLGLGKDNASNAMVLFTTQQMLESRLDGHSFNEAITFLYRGNVRSIRIWDESYLPGESIVINEYNLWILSGTTWKMGEIDLATALRDLSDTISKCKAGNTIKLPDFEAVINTPSSRLVSHLRLHTEITDGLSKDMDALFYLSGRKVSIHLDGGPKGGAKALSFRETLPNDLAPLLVTDASGRVRHTYKLMKQERNNILELKTATKTYRNLSAFVWRTGGGKGAWQTNSGELMQGIVRTISEEPTERWLIVHHKPMDRSDKSIPDLSKAIPTMLPPEINVRFVTWGQHAASNDYRDCNRIILAGTLFYDNSQYEAQTRLCGNYQPGEKAPTQDERRKMKLGEDKHNILQATCRGILRVSQNGDCPPCKVFIIASDQSGIKGILTTPEENEYDPSYIFPHCNVEEWNVMRGNAVDRLKGNMKKAYEYLKSWATTAACGEGITLGDLRIAVGAKDAKSFNNLLKAADIVEALGTIGVALDIPRTRVKGIVKV